MGYDPLVENHFAGIYRLRKVNWRWDLSVRYGKDSIYSSGDFPVRLVWGHPLSCRKPLTHNPQASQVNSLLPQFNFGWNVLWWGEPPKEEADICVSPRKAFSQQKPCFQPLSNEKVIIFSYLQPFIVAKYKPLCPEHFHNFNLTWSHTKFI